ncbi:orotidine-5'-phosphate decarboxylase [Candidatus Peregrinibacteria bacterium]|nr:orotidine-5'-phosphate decarboxylase [Candidatus Peregrinibacteria bacterium]
MKHFSDRLIEAIKAKKSVVCVGLDPRLDKIPEFIRKKYFKKLPLKRGVHPKFPLLAASEAILEFNKGIIDAVADIAVAVKPQIAFYEMFGAEGVNCFIETIKYAKSKGLLTIADAKRGDIGTTAEAYAKAFLGKVDVGAEFGGAETEIFGADSITVVPYFGFDGIKPFIEECKKNGKGMFILVKTSNKTAGDLQDLIVEKENATAEKSGNAGQPVYKIMAQYVESWGANDIGENGYSCVGAVVGATYPQQVVELRKIMPHTIFLVPGYGAQGGTAKDVEGCFNKDGLGAIVNSSREIIFAYEKSEKGETAYAEISRAAAEKMRMDIAAVL